jgi:carboxylesterase type B
VLAGPPGAPGGFESSLAWTPVVDNQVIFGEPTQQIQTAGNLKGKALLLGTNKDEGLLFVDLVLQSFGQKLSQIGLSPGFTTIPKGAYGLALAKLFGLKNVSAIQSFTPPGSSNQPYAAVTGDNPQVLAKVFTDYLFTCANRYFARQAVGTVPTFVYQFDQPTSLFTIPPCPLALSCTSPPCPAACAAPEICHGAELPYVFHSASDIDKTFAATEDSVSRTMAGFWGNFATLLNPNGAQGSQWPTFNAQTGPYIVLDSPLSQASSIPDPICDFWDSIGYNLVPPQTSCQ